MTPILFEKLAEVLIEDLKKSPDPKTVAALTYYGDQAVGRFCNEDIAKKIIVEAFRQVSQITIAEAVAVLYRHGSPMEERTDGR